MLGLLPAGEKKREGQDEQHQRLLALQRSHIYDDGSDNDNDTKNDNADDDDNDDSDNDEILMPLALSYILLIVLTSRFLVLR